MARKQCRACGGTYQEIGRDGVPYFHVCAPETVLRVRRDNGDVFEQPLAALAGLTLAASVEEKQSLVDKGADPATIAVVLRRRDRPRAGHRDENTASREGARREIRVLKSEGLGAIDIADDVEEEA